METDKLKSMILEKAHIGIWTIEIEDGSKPRMYADDCMKALLGITEDISPEETYSKWYSRIDPDYYAMVNRCIENVYSGIPAEVEYPWHHPTQGLVYVRCGGIRDKSYTKGVRFQGFHQDITKVYSLHKDSLTSLYTKEYFFQRAEEIMKENPDVEYRIMLSDIENFKMINEKYGTEKSNELLKYLADALKHTDPDNFILGARLSGDQFVCLQYGKKHSRAEGLQMQERVLKNSPIPSLTWKHGIYYTSFDRTVSVQAMCDRARYAANSIKGNYCVNCAVYDDALRKNLLMHQLIEESMESALEKNQYTIYLQPEHNLHTNKTGGAEALVRWEHPDIGLIQPGTFIPIFEKNGFITSVDRYVLTKVCQTLRKWLDENKPIVPVSVNFSGVDFDYPDLADTIIKIVDSYKIPHELVNIEITESAFSNNQEQTTAIVKKLHDHGFLIELDDFGTGYTSLLILNELPLDAIKLDMSLVQKDHPGQAHNILDFCGKLVKLMRISSVAEGVETGEQLDRIKEIGCDYVQGYFYSKPLPIKEFEQYLESHI